MNFLIQIIVGVILTVASTLLQQAFAPKTDQQRRTGTRGSAQIGGKVPQNFLVGTVGEPGKLEYRNSWGNAGGVPNAYSVDVYSFGDLPLTAMTKLFVNGVEETISSTGHVTQGYPSNGDKAGYLWVEFHDGSQTVADTYLTSKFGADADRPWLSDMIGNGVPYLVTTSLWNEKLWTGFPRFMVEFQGIRLYDPRQDTTAGGSGSQRWGQPETYAFSDNNLVIIYNILRGIHYEGTRIWGGSATAAQLPYAVWAAAMDACDESVTLAGGGTEKRFRAGRRIDLNERPADVIKELLIGANARISHASDGTVYVIVGVPDEVDGAFTDADVLASEPLGSIPFPNLDEIINGATATYREPTQAWEDKETAPYYRSDLEAEDDGRRQIEGLDLGTTFSGTQAQRILQAVIEEGRRFRRHVVALPPEFAQFRPLQQLAWTSDRFDYSDKRFLVTARTRDPWGNVILGLQEIDPADHDWNPETDEQPLNFAPVVTNRPPPQEVSGFHVAPAIAEDSAGNARRPAIDVFWSSASVTEDVRAVRITVRLAADDTLVWEGEAPRPETGSARLTEALLPAEDYEVQIEYRPRSGRATVASSWLPVTTPDVRFNNADIGLSAVEIENLAQDLQNSHGVLMEPGAGSLAERLIGIEERIALQEAALADHMATYKVRTSLLKALNGGVSAAVVREERVRAEEDAALAQLIEEVAVEIAENLTAGGLFQITGEVDGTGEVAKASILMKVRAQVEDVFGEAALQLRAQANGAGGTISDVVIMANRLIFIDDNGNELVAPFQVIDGEVIFQVAYFRTLKSIATSASGDPIIHLDGDTGFFSFG